MHIFMENKRHSELTSEHHLPEELCRDILSRLPVKSLLRFRCVSKSWLSFINDPDFGLVHLENFKNNRDETHLLVVEGKPKHCVIRCSDTFETNRETLVTLPPRYRELEWTVKCSVNGLVLLQTSYRRDSSARANDLMVWNPSIRKFHAIPSLPETESKTSPNSSFKEVDIGMGYDPLVKDYKHVKLIRGNANIPPLVAIYTIGDGSWKMSQFQGKEFSSFEWDFGSIHRDVVYLRGSLYFLVTNREGEVLGLVSFDLTCEEFCSVSLPEYEKGVRLVRYGCSSLAMFFMEEYVFMWVLEIESMCWTKRYSLHLLVPDELLYLKTNRDMLMWWSQNLAEFSVATSDSFRQWCQLVTSYNLESKEEKIKLLEKQDDDFDIWGVYGYIESLALLK